VGVGSRVVLLREQVALGPGLWCEVGSLREQDQLPGTLIPANRSMLIPPAEIPLIPPLSKFCIKGDFELDTAFSRGLKVHKREKFFGSDFEFFTIL
jgi:hypothetical protein